MGLTSAPATEAIMGVVPIAKAGVGSAVNDATRLLGGTLGVAVIGSVYASLYASRLTASLPARLPATVVHVAHESVGAALILASHLGHGALGAGLHAAASSAFFDGFHAANIVLAGVTGLAAVVALALLPGRPARAGVQAGDVAHTRKTAAAVAE